MTPDMKMNLVQAKCTPCASGDKPISTSEAKSIARSIPEWKLLESKIERDFKFGDFQEAMSFVNQVADIANEEGHHPDILISYSKVHITLSTHKVGGLTRNDFILAAKIDRLMDSSRLYRKAA